MRFEQDEELARWFEELIITRYHADPWEKKKGSFMKKSSKDIQIAEFKKKDLGGDVRKSRSAMLVTTRSRPTSILLPEALVVKLRKKADKRGIGYQTMLKIILTEQVDQY